MFNLIQKAGGEMSCPERVSLKHLTPQYSPEDVLMEIVGKAEAQEPHRFHPRGYNVARLFSMT